MSTSTRRYFLEVIVSKDLIFDERGQNSVFSNSYRVDTKLGKFVCSIHRIPCACPSCVAQLDKYWLPNCDTSSQPMCYRVENCYYNKIFKHYNNLIIIEVLDNNTPQVEFDNIH